MVLVTVLALLAGAVLYGAYGYLPAEAGRGYQPHYNHTVASRFVDTPVARFHYLHAGNGSPVVLLSPGAAWGDRLEGAAAGAGARPQRVRRRPARAGLHAVA
jgi:hypothetical protein